MVEAENMDRNLFAIIERCIPITVHGYIRARGTSKMTAPFAVGLGVVLAATMAPPAQARHASQECQGGLPVLTLLEGGGYAVNAYRLDCGKGAARSALVIPDGAAATGDGVTCSLGREPFDLTGDMVDASGIRAAGGDTVRCTDGQAVVQSKSRRRKPPAKRYVTLRPSDAAPLPGGTVCEASNETLSGSFMLTGKEVDVTVAAILVDCGASAGSALIVPRGATTAVAPIIKGVRLSCPADRLSIPNRPTGRSGNQVVVADDQIANCKASLGGRHRDTASFDLTLGGVEPLGCGDSGSKCVFVTSTSRNGSFGGLAVADTECATLAASAGLPGSYKAWLSDDTASPSTRFTRASVPYALVDGTQIADDWTDLTTCNADFSSCIDNLINLDEKENGFSNLVWTGTRTDGSNVPGANCSNWTEADGFTAVAGSASNASDAWTGSSPVDIGIEAGCEADFRFYCFQQ